MGFLYRQSQQGSLHHQFELSLVSNKSIRGTRWIEKQQQKLRDSKLSMIVKQRKPTM